MGPPGGVDRPIIAGSADDRRPGASGRRRRARRQARPDPDARRRPPRGRRVPPDDGRDRRRCRWSWTTSRTARTRSTSRPSRHYLELPRHGYVARPSRHPRHRRVRRATRSTSTSLEEQLDGYDAIEWVAAQPWCDGHVNLMGISYGGFTALQVATHQPPHLTSIIPVDFTDDRYTDDCHYRGGLLRMYYDVGWYGTRMIAWNAMPPDPDVRATTGPRSGDATSPRTSRICCTGSATRSTARTGAHGSVAGIARPDRLPDVPHRRLARRLPEPAAPAVRGACAAPKKLLVGPWDHALPGRGHPGSADRPPARGRPLARPLEPRSRRAGCHGRAADRGVHAGAGAARRRTGSTSRASGGRSVPGRSRALTERVLTLGGGRAGSIAGDEPTTGEDRLTVDPTVGVTMGGLWSGGVPVRAARRPAAGRGLLARLHVGAARTNLCDPRPGARGPRIVASSATVAGFAVSPHPTSRPTAAPISSRRACSTPRAARR